MRARIRRLDTQIRLRHRKRTAIDILERFNALDVRRPGAHAPVARARSV
jgi:hypothetical protein